MARVVATESVKHLATGTLKSRLNGAVMPAGQSGRLALEHPQMMALPRLQRDNPAGKSNDLSNREDGMLGPSTKSQLLQSRPSIGDKALGVKSCIESNCLWVAIAMRVTTDERAR